MNERRRFKFSLANLLLMVAPVAVFGAVLCAVRQQPTWFIFSVAMIGGPTCVSAAVGALTGGFRTMGSMAAFFFVLSVLGTALFWFMGLQGWLNWLIR